MLFLVLVAVPAARRLTPPASAQAVSLMGRRFRVVGWLAMVVLLLTGAVDAAYHGITPAAVLGGSAFESTFGLTLGIKLGLFLTMVALSVAHDFVLGPRAADLQRQAMGQPGLVSRAARLRASASWLARFNLLLGLVVLGLAVSLFRPV